VHKKQRWQELEQGDRASYNGETVCIVKTGGIGQFIFFKSLKEISPDTRVRVKVGCRKGETGTIIRVHPTNKAYWVVKMDKDGVERGLRAKTLEPKVKKEYRKEDSTLEHTPVPQKPRRDAMEAIKRNYPWLYENIKGEIDELSESRCKVFC